MGRMKYWTGASWADVTFTIGEFEDLKKKYKKHEIDTEEFKALVVKREEESITLFRKTLDEIIKFDKYLKSTFNWDINKNISNVRGYGYSENNRIEKISLKDIDTLERAFSLDTENIDYYMKGQIKSDINIRNLEIYLTEEINESNFYNRPNTPGYEFLIGTVNNISSKYKDINILIDKEKFPSGKKLVGIKFKGIPVNSKENDFIYIKDLFISREKVDNKNMNEILLSRNANRDYLDFLLEEIEKTKKKINKYIDRSNNQYDYLLRKDYWNETDEGLFEYKVELSNSIEESDSCYITIDENSISAATEAMLKPDNSIEFIYDKKYLTIYARKKPQNNIRCNIKII